MTFLEFLHCKNISNGSINEAFKESDLDKAIKLIANLLSKETNTKIVELGTLDMNRGGKDFTSYMLCISTGASNEFDKLLTIDFLKSDKSRVPYSFAFYNKDTLNKILWGDDKELSVKSVLSVYTLGASIIYFIPIMARVIQTNKFELTKDEVQRAATGVFKEGQIDFFLKKSGIIFDGLLKYNVYDTIYNGNKNIDIIKEAFTQKISEMKTELQQKRKEVAKQYRQATIANDDQELIKRLRSEYYHIRKAINGGATTVEEMDMMIKNGELTTISSPTKSMNKEVQKQVEEVKHKEPELAFKEMRGYLSMVTSGIQPGLIICGAPGIGKTYRVMKFLKSKGYNDDVNMHVIKGRCTTRNLFLDLYKFQNKGEIIVIDDADSLIGPKAPEDTINILKAALDSNDNDGKGRKISYRITGRLTDDDGVEIPKTFYYSGSVIVLTNYSVGQLDSAIRGRVFTQDLNFSSQQLLSLIKQIMPAIEEGRLSSVAKIKAFDYLSDLADEGSQMEVSIRSFVTCARLFQSQQENEDFSDDEIKSMIKDQVTNQAIKGGKKY